MQIYSCPFTRLSSLQITKLNHISSFNLHQNNIISYSKNYQNLSETLFIMTKQVNIEFLRFQ